MVASSLNRRVGELESKAGGFRPYLAIRQYAGETEGDALAQHERGNGPCEDGCNLLFIQIRGLQRPKGRLSA